MNEKNFYYLGYIDSGIICGREGHLKGIEELFDSFLKEGEEYQLRRNLFDECPSVVGGAHYGQEVWGAMENGRRKEFRKLVKRVAYGEV